MIFSILSSWGIRNDFGSILTQRPILVEGLKLLTSSRLAASAFDIPSFLIHIASLNTVGSSAVVISEDNGFTLSATGRNAHNFGNHFNEADGKFTVPVAGLYFFGYSIMRLSTSGTGAVDIRIMKNGTANSLYSRNYQGSYQTNFQAEGNGTIARLNKNDYIQFRVGANMSIHDDDSYFYGYLIG